MTTTTHTKGRDLEVAEQVLELLESEAPTRQNQVMALLRAAEPALDGKSFQLAREIAELLAALPSARRTPVMAFMASRYELPAASPKTRTRRSFGPKPRRRGR